MYSPRITAPTNKLAVILIKVKIRWKKKKKKVCIYKCVEMPRHRVKQHFNMPNLTNLAKTSINILTSPRSGSTATRVARNTAYIHVTVAKELHV